MEKPSKKDKDIVNDFDIHCRDVKAQLAEQCHLFDWKIGEQNSQLSEISEFCKRRAEIEAEYARSLDRLVKQSMTRCRSDKTRREVCARTTYNLWYCIQALFENAKRCANQHLSYAEFLSGRLMEIVDEIVKNISTVQKKYREILAKQQDEVNRHVSEIKTKMDLYRKKNTNYQAELKQLKHVQTQRSKQPNSQKTRAALETQQQKVAAQSAELSESRNDCISCVEGVNSMLDHSAAFEFPQLLSAFEGGFNTTLVRTFQLHQVFEENLAKGHQLATENLQTNIAELRHYEPVPFYPQSELDDKSRTGSLQRARDRESSSGEETRADEIARLADLYPAAFALDRSRVHFTFYAQKGDDVDYLVPHPSLGQRISSLREHLQSLSLVSYRSKMEECRLRLRDSLRIFERILAETARKFSSQLHLSGLTIANSQGALHKMHHASQSQSQSQSQFQSQSQSLGLQSQCSQHPVAPLTMPSNSNSSSSGSNSSSAPSSASSVPPAQLQMQMPNMMTMSMYAGSGVSGSSAFGLGLVPAPSQQPDLIPSAPVSQTLAQTLSQPETPASNPADLQPVKSSELKKSIAEIHNIELEYAKTWQEFSKTRGICVRIESRLRTMQAMQLQAHSGALHPDVRSRGGTSGLRPYSSRSPMGNGKLLAMRMFGVELDTYLEQSGEAIPRVMENCIFYLTRNGLHTVGIFRINGTQSIMSQLREKMERGEEPLCTEDEPASDSNGPEKDRSQGEEAPDADTSAPYDVFSVASLLKAYLRELKQPLLPPSVLERCYSTAFPDSSGTTKQQLQLLETSSAIENQAIQVGDQLRSLIPYQRYIVIRYLIGFLNTVANYEDENMMDAENLGTCFAPTLCRFDADIKAIDPTQLDGTGDIFSRQNQANKFVSYIIRNYRIIFSIKDGSNNGPIYEECPTSPDVAPLDIPIDNDDSTPNSPLPSSSSSQLFGSGAVRLPAFDLQAVDQTQYGQQQQQQQGVGLPGQPSSAVANIALETTGTHQQSTLLRSQTQTYTPKIPPHGVPVSKGKPRPSSQNEDSHTAAEAYSHPSTHMHSNLLALSSSETKRKSAGETYANISEFTGGSQTAIAGINQLQPLATGAVLVQGQPPPNQPNPSSKSFHIKTSLSQTVPANMPPSETVGISATSSVTQMGSQIPIHRHAGSSPAPDLGLSSVDTKRVSSWASSGDKTPVGSTSITEGNFSAFQSSLGANASPSQIPLATAVTSSGSGSIVAPTPTSKRSRTKDSSNGQNLVKLGSTSSGFLSNASMATAGTEAGHSKPLHSQHSFAATLPMSSGAGALNLNVSDIPQRTRSESLTHSDREAQQERVQIPSISTSTPTIGKRASPELQLVPQTHTASMASTLNERTPSVEAMSTSTTGSSNQKLVAIPIPNVATITMPAPTQGPVIAPPPQQGPIACPPSLVAMMSAVHPQEQPAKRVSPSSFPLDAIRTQDSPDVPLAPTLQIQAGLMPGPSGIPGQPDMPGVPSQRLEMQMQFAKVGQSATLSRLHGVHAHSTSQQLSSSGSGVNLAVSSSPSSGTSAPPRKLLSGGSFRQSPNTPRVVPILSDDMGMHRAGASPSGQPTPLYPSSVQMHTTASPSSIPLGVQSARTEPEPPAGSSFGSSAVLSSSSPTALGQIGASSKPPPPTAKKPAFPASLKM